MISHFFLARLSHRSGASGAKPLAADLETSSDLPPICRHLVGSDLPRRLRSTEVGSDLTGFACVPARGSATRLAAHCTLGSDKLTLSHARTSARCLGLALAVWNSSLFLFQLFLSPLKTSGRAATNTQQTRKLIDAGTRFELQPSLAAQRGSRCSLHAPARTAVVLKISLPAPRVRGGGPAPAAPVAGARGAHKTRPDQITRPDQTKTKTKTRQDKT